jgi:DDE superfamily endonuclease
VAEGTPYVILDGKIVASDRCHEKTVSRQGRDIDLWYSGKKKDFGGNVQALFYPGGLPMWVSDVLPGNVHDLAAARENVLPVLREYTDTMPCLADCGYEGAGHGVLTPVKKPKGVTELDGNARTRNMLLSSARCLGERGFALLSQRWKTLQDVTASPSEIGPIARAALVLVLFEHKRLTLKSLRKLQYCVARSGGCDPSDRRLNPGFWAGKKRAGGEGRAEVATRKGEARRMRHAAEAGPRLPGPRGKHL